MFDKNIFSERLKQLRLSKNMSQKDIADIAGISQSAIGKIENKRGAASLEVTCAIAEYFDVSSDYLLGLSDIKERK